ncbi:transmembrane emp24 domain-containing protein 10 isoform X2 [Nematostella vectensis]|uniref:transmembrane emp24 domain-containing protein 10 isoform X2 n=1 Tax=Nematostella vectensis TaxID=45351 RepID=UPI00138FD6A6|nr:transmembrane emp24 domain-containing protein 10 isoform X2 [Nematostella vectensis]
MRELILSLLLIVSFFCNYTNGLGFKIKAATRKCLTDFAQKDQLFKADYEISHDQSSTVKITVIDIDVTLQLLFTKENATKGKFAFTFDRDGHFDLCFDNQVRLGSGSDSIVFLKIKRGSEAKNYENLALAQKLQPQEIEVMRLADMSSEVLTSLGRLINRGEDHLITNESTGARILYLGVFLTMLLVMLTGGQLVYLHRFFAAKKLI